MPYIGKQLVRGQNRKLDDISSGFNGSQTTFTLQIASQNVSVGSALQLWISVGGVIQNPLTDFTIAGNQITFTTAPAASLDFFGVIQGDVTDTNTPGDATVTTSKLSTGLTVNLADGSAATSSLQLGGTDSGLFSSAADKVNVTTGGVERLEIGSSEVVFNDGSNDVDFRVESNGNANMLFVDAGNDRVGIGTSSPSVPFTVQSDSGTNAIAVLGRSADDISSTLFYENDGTTQIGRIQARQSYLHISGTDNTKGIYIDNSGRVLLGTTTEGEATADNLTIADSGHCGITLRSGTSSVGTIFFSDATSGAAEYQGYVQYDHSANYLKWATAGTERARLDSSGRLLVGTSSFTGEASAVLEGSSAGGTTQAQLWLNRGQTSPSTDNVLGQIIFGDATASGRNGAMIQARVDSSWGSNDYPSRLAFFTTADGASSPTERMRISQNGHVKCPGFYAPTTSSGANMHVESDGDVKRSTSSKKYKTAIEDVENTYSDALLNCRPVWYRSTCTGDNPEHGFWGFIAEEVAEIDPRLVFWKTNEVTYDANGSAVATPCEPEAEGVQYDRFVPHLLNLIKRQQAAIATLETKVAALEAG